MIVLSLGLSMMLQLSVTRNTHIIYFKSCYMDITSSGKAINLGCTDNQQCGFTGSDAGSLVGRDLKERQTSDCHECCSTDKCNKNLCVHLKLQVGWAKWSNWDTCSVTCGIGIQRRYRKCSNPLPETNGHLCDGVSSDARVCLPGPCANGGWSDWEHWSPCTVTCGDGFQTRSRTCTRPRPSPLGKYCEGNPLEVVSCKRDVCTPNIVFKAKGVTNTSPTAGQTMIFGTTLVNEGHAYDTSTGIFVAPVNGTYSFSTQFCVHPQNQLYIAIIVDGITYATMYAYDKDSYPCNTADTVAVLHAQSKVWVKCTYVYGSGSIIYETDDRINSFSGYLVHR